MNAKIIAVDFDGCLVKNAYPDIGDENHTVVTALMDEQRAGAKIILWTCRSADLLFAAVDWASNHGIMFDAINENLPDVIASFGGDTRKIFANEYWDDRAVRMPDV